MTDPSHPAFLTKDEIVSLFYRAGFRRVAATVIPYRSAWFQKWLRAEQANTTVEAAVLAMYRDAPNSFIDRHRVVIKNNEITSTVPWLLLRAYK